MRRCTGPTLGTVGYTSSGAGAGMCGDPVPLLDIEEYAQHLVVNTNRRYDRLDNATIAKDHDMKLASWKYTRSTRLSQPTTLSQYPPPDQPVPY